MDNSKEQKKGITEAELRKEKLKELHQKATGIVKKNVDAKRRERSKQRQPQGTIRSKSCSSITKSCESVIISCNSAISIKRGLKQYLQVPQSEITPPINLKKSKSTHNISSIHSESRSHPLNLNIDGIGEQESPRDITIEVKRNQGAIPKRPRLSDLQLPRNVTLRSNHSEEGYTSDFLPEFSGRTNKSKNIFKSARTPAVFFALAVVFYIASGLFGLLGVYSLANICNLGMAVAFITLSTWAYVRYSGELREVGMTIDETANFIWENLMKPVANKWLSK